MCRLYSLISESRNVLHRYEVIKYSEMFRFPILFIKIYRYLQNTLFRSGNIVLFIITCISIQLSYHFFYIEILDISILWYYSFERTSLHVHLGNKGLIAVWELQLWLLEYDETITVWICTKSTQIFTITGGRNDR